MFFRLEYIVTRMARSTPPAGHPWEFDLQDSNLTLKTMKCVLNMTGINPTYFPKTNRKANRKPTDVGKLTKQSIESQRISAPWPHIEPDWLYLLRGISTSQNRPK